MPDGKEPIVATYEDVVEVIDEELDDLNAARAQLGFNNPLTKESLLEYYAFMQAAMALDDPYGATLLPLLLQFFDGLKEVDAIEKAASVMPATKP